MKRFCVLLIVSVLALTAGCVEPDAVVTVEKLNDSTEVAESASIELEDTTSPIEEAVLNNQSNRTVIDMGDSTLVSYDGQYYNVSMENAGTGDVIIADIDVSKTEDSEDYIPEDIPSKDVDPIRNFERYEDRDVSSGILDQRYVAENINNSVLLNKEEMVVRFEDENYRLTVNRTDRRTEDLFTYTSEVRFESSEEYYNYIEDNYMFELSEIPNGSEKIWNQAVNDGYYGESTEEFEILKQRFEQEEAFKKEEYSGEWYVRYDGGMYKVKLDWISE